MGNYITRHSHIYGFATGQAKSFMGKKNKYQENKLDLRASFKIFKVIHYFCTSITVKLALDPHSPFAQKNIKIRQKTRRRTNESFNSLQTLC